MRSGMWGANRRPRIRLVTSGMPTLAEVAGAWLPEVSETTGIRVPEKCYSRGTRLLRSTVRMQSKGTPATEVNHTRVQKSAYSRRALVRERSDTQ